MNQEIQQDQQGQEQEIQPTQSNDKKRICKLFLKRKNRFCRFECIDGLDYCHHHAHENALFLEESNNKLEGSEQKQNQQATENLKKDIINQTGRIPCPLDPNHSVDINKLEKHLKKCQSVKQKNNVENNIWFSKGINNKQNLSEQKQLELFGEEQQQNAHEQDSKKLLQKLFNEQSPQLQKLVEKIELNFLKAVSLYKQQAEVNEMTEEELYNYLLDITDDADQEKIIKKLKTENQGLSDTQKDHRQVCKMVEVLKQQNIWNPQFIYIEFGAGKGLLSHGIARSLQLPNDQDLTCEILMDSLKENSINCKINLKKANKQTKKQSTDQIQEEEAKISEEVTEQVQKLVQDKKTDQSLEHKEETNYKPYHACHILLELESRRNKMDRLHRDNPFYLRYRTNILDFNVNTIKQLLQEKNYPYIDSSLRVIGVSKHMCGGATDLSINTLLNCESPQQFEGMMIATCCHHRCNLDTYTNNDFLMKDLGYTKEDLEILFFCSSWYSSGQVKEEILKRIEMSEQENIEIQQELKQTQQPSEKEWLSFEKKSLIGKMVKRTIDIGRILNLIKKGKQGRIVKYCDFILSPENFVIIAK